MSYFQNSHAVLYAFFGAAFTSWLMMRIIWMPDPPPFVKGKYLPLILAGAVGGLVGGYLGADNILVSLIGAGSGSAILTGAVAILGNARK